MNFKRLQTPTIAVAVAALVVGASGGAAAAKLITGKDIKNGSITTKDIKNGTLTSSDIKNGTLTSSDIKKGSVGGDRLKKGAIGTDRLKDGSVTSAKIKDGTIGANDLSSAAKNSLKTTYAGPNWSIVDRNVIGDGDAFLRSGPTSAFGGVMSAPPYGIGSLGIRTGSGDDKVAFGDQVDFQGMDFSSITAVGYWAFTTMENITAGGTSVNLPTVQFEINPNLSSNPTSFSTADFFPAAGSNTPGWNNIDAVTTGNWALTGAAGTATGCTDSTPCTWDDLQAALSDGGDPATIFTVQIDKGRDFAYSGAVDGLRINNNIYNFEPFGVTITHP